MFPPLKNDMKKDRLGLARWLLDPAHPMTSRVAVNRFWQQVFGTGLVKTTEDMGLQGEPPTHQELLDWLAVEFRESGWDVKKLMKLMVMSNTYQQSAKVTAIAMQQTRAIITTLVVHDIVSMRRSFAISALCQWFAGGENGRAQYEASTAIGSVGSGRVRQQ